MPSLLIEAGPGTGKTTTMSFITTYLRATNKEAWHKMNKNLTEEQVAIINWCHTHLPQEGTMIGMAYNKEAANHLDSRTHPSVECRSVHGWGYKVLMKHFGGYVQMNDSAPINHVEQLTGRVFNSLPDKYAWLCAIKFFEKLKDELLPPTLEALQYLSQKYDDLASFKYDHSTPTRIEKLIPLAKKPDKKIGITYADQTWLACFLLKAPLYDIAIIDECQDISASRRFVCNAIAKHKIWIGDRYQAINAFAGADAKSIDRIQDLVEYQLPLKQSFRNPPYVIKKLNKLRPLAKLTGLDKPDGVEERIELDDFPQKVLEAGPANTLTLSRTNAPLIRAAYKLLQAQIPCRILGDRVVDQLTNIIKKQQASNMEEFLIKLKKYEKVICSSLDEYVGELFKDKLNCIRLVAPHCNTPEELEKELRRLFKPSGDSHATLCTIHKGKGLESPNVFILFPPIESPLAKTIDQKEQELNLRYVAESRTSLNTYWVVE